MQELLSNLGIDWRLLIAQAVNFLLVLWLLSKFVFPKILNYLEERKNKIDQGFELTEKAEREMERINAARNRELEKARQEAEKILADAGSIASEKEKAALALTRQKADKIIIKAQEEAEREKLDAIRDSKKEMQKLSVAMAEKILSRSVEKEDEEKAAEEVMSYFEKNKFTT